MFVHNFFLSFGLIFFLVVIIKLKINVILELGKHQTKYFFVFSSITSKRLLLSFYLLSFLIICFLILKNKTLNDEHKMMSYIYSYLYFMRVLTNECQ